MGLIERVAARFQLVIHAIEPDFKSICEVKNLVRFLLELDFRVLVVNLRIISILRMHFQLLPGLFYVVD